MYSKKRLYIYLYTKWILYGFGAFNSEKSNTIEECATFFITFKNVSFHILEVVPLDTPRKTPLGAIVFFFIGQVVILNFIPCLFSLDIS